MTGPVSRQLGVVPRYASAIAITGLVVVLRTILDPLLMDSPGAMLFALAVIASSYVGGLGPSLLTACISAITVTYFWVEPQYVLAMTGTDWVNLFLFLLLAVAISGVTTSLHRTRNKAMEQKNDALRARDALAQTEARFVGFMQHVPAAAWIKDLQGRYVYANDDAYRLLHGADPQSLRQVSELLQPTDAERLAAIDARVLLNGVPEKVVFPLQLHNRLGYFELYKFPIRNAGGRSVFWGGLLFDVTERELAQQKFNREVAFRRAIERALPSGIAAIDNEGRQTYVSPGLCRMVGYSEEELIGQHPPFIYWPEDQLEAIERLLQEMRADTTNNIHSAELQFQRRDKSRVDVMVQVAKIHDEEGNAMGWLGAVTDITERKEYMRYLEQFTEMLEQRVAERTAIAEQRAHQLRMLNAELVQTERRERRRFATLLHDHLQQYLVAAKMKAAAAMRHTMPDGERLMTEVQSLIDDAISATRTLTFELSPPMLDKGLIPCMNWLARNMEEKHNLRLHMRLDETAEPSSEAVRMLMFEVVRELLFNVAKHARVQSASVEMHKRDSHMEMVIADNGVGFDVDTALLSNGEHFGLASVRERLEAIDGELHIDSRIGGGTRITVTAPLSGDKVPVTSHT